ncbi:contactin-like [Culicoides brevitarsis]|uniref:contactin-like n=1 Tax=Culicoides brevitarsis TaxID=469753 RepID=UPI00307C8A6D
MAWRLVALCALLCIYNSGAQRDYDRDYGSERERNRNRDDGGYKPNYQPGYGINNRFNVPSTLRPLSGSTDRFPSRFDNSEPNRDLSGASFYDTSRYGHNYNSYSNFIDGVDESFFCPEHWITYRQSCYRFIKSPKRSWWEAKRICEAYQAKVVDVDNVEKHSFILKHLILQDQRQNRYFVSARRTGPTSWVNDDGTALVVIEDGINYDDELNESPETKYRGYEGFDTDLPDFDNSLHKQFRTTSRRPDTYNIYDRYNLNKDRLVYAYSRSKDRWMFIPTYEREPNLFICESRQLYDIKNVEKIEEDKRTIEYGMDYYEEERLPRGPYFIKQPSDTTYDTGKRLIRNDVSIGCLAGGYPTPTYSWYKEEYKNDNLTFIKIDPLTNPRYTISGGNLIIYNPQQDMDQGTYHCVAENKFGKILSESVQLNLGYILEFNLKRSPENGEMNWGKSIYCDPPQHFPGVKYYWSRDYFPNFVEEDRRVFVSNDGALYFSALESIDRGNYSCTVQSTVSDTGRNGPFFPLRVKPHPNYQTLVFANTFPKVFPEGPVAGHEVRIECMAFGYPVPHYNWTRRDADLPRHAYTLNYNRVLIIPNATLNDNGEYVCTVFNDRKTIDKSVHVNLQMKPNFTIPLRDKIKDHGGEVSFICEANAVPDVNYTWYKNGDLLDRESLDKEKYVIQDNVLTIKFLDPDKDNGMYQCKATNQLRGVYSSSQLRVLSLKPTFKKFPLEQEIYAIYGGNTTIDCKPEAAPRPKITWKKDGNVLGPGGHRRMLPDGKLIISPTSRDDEGVYTCVASNVYGTDESSARLIVLREIQFSKSFAPKIHKTIDEYLYLTCEVYYDEILDVAYIWQHNGQVIDPHMDPRYKIDNNNGLVLHNLTITDTGEYECIAKSAVNQVSQKTMVIVQGPPARPGGVKIIEINKRDAIIEWVDGGNNGRPITHYNVLGRTNWNKTWTNVSEMIEDRNVERPDRFTDRRRATVLNLTPWSSYEFAVCAVNDLGIGAPSEPSPSYSTKPDKPDIAPRNVGGGGGKIGDLVITWDPLRPEEQNAKGIKYKYFYRKHGKKGETEWASDIKEGNVGQAVVHFDNKETIYYTKFDVKVQAMNDFGAGPESNVTTIYSAEDMPQVAPQQVYARGFNSTAINVTWAPVDQTREKIRGQLIGHRIKYWKKDHREEDAVYYLSRTTRPWALIVGLEPDTYYFVKSMAYNAAGEGPESERYMERTYRKAPQKPPSTVHIYGINPTTVRVVWRYVAPTQEEEPIEGYKVRIWESDQDMSRANDTIIPVGNKLEAYIDTLTPGKSYKMRVLAFSNGGDGRMSSPPLKFQMGITQSPYNAATTIKLCSSLLLPVYLWYLVQGMFN